MKLISAIIKPFKLEEVRQALLDFGVEGLRKLDYKKLVSRLKIFKSYIT